MDWTTLILMAIVIIIVICWFLHILWGARIMNKLTADRDQLRRERDWLAGEKVPKHPDDRFKCPESCGDDCTFSYENCHEMGQEEWDSIKKCCVNCWVIAAKAATKEDAHDH